ncbi:single-stranded DNA-binding protein [Microbacterium sp. NPDC091313]
MTEIITVTGNVATEPERRTLPGGASVTSFRVASTHRRFDRASGAWVDQYTNWYSVSAFRALGEHAHSSLHRGDRVIVVGRMHLREWDNGTRAGTSADIDADAIGPDLLFGTTVYTPANRPAAPPAADTTEAVAVAAEPAGRDADGWSIPQAEPAASGELVDATADTPF